MYQEKVKAVELTDLTFARALPLSADKIEIKVHLDVASSIFSIEVSLIWIS